MCYFPFFLNARSVLNDVNYVLFFQNNCLYIYDFFYFLEECLQVMECSLFDSYELGGCDRPVDCFRLISVLFTSLN